MHDVVADFEALAQADHGFGGQLSFEHSSPDEVFSLHQRMVLRFSVCLWLIEPKRRIRPVVSSESSRSL